MASPVTDLRSAGTPSLPSRRQCLGWAAAGLAAPLLQACGGDGSGTATFLPVPPTTPPGADAASVQWCREAIREALGRSGSATTAVSVALLADDRVVWREAFGYADPENGLLASPETRFNIGSVAKVVATLAVMILRDRGQLSLEQPLVELLPTFSMRSPAFRQITVRHLLHHAAGFPGTNDRNSLNFVPVLDYAQDTLKALAELHLKHAPGELSVYCNDGFTLIEPLVLHLTGLSFPDFVQREIFGPLGMTLSGYATAPAAEGTFVHPYYKGQRQPQEMAACFATGGVLTTPTDMLKLARLLLDEGVYEGRRIVSAAAVQEMGRNQDPRTRINLTPDLHWGLGWDSVRQAGMHAAGLRGWRKGGNTDLFATELFVLPEARMALLITGAGQDYGPTALAEGLLLRVAAERGVVQSLPAAIAPAVLPPAAPVPDRSALVGIYGNYNTPLEIRAESDGSMRLRNWTQAGWTTDHIRARSDGFWWSDAAAERCYRFQTVQGNLYVIERKLSPNKLYWEESPLGQWLAPVTQPLSPAWQGRVGTEWRCTNNSPDSVASRLYPLMGRIGELAEMPGYVMWNDAQLLRVVNDQEAGMTVKIPLYGSRDLVELRMVTEAGRAEELHIGSLIYQKKAATP